MDIWIDVVGVGRRLPNISGRFSPGTKFAWNFFQINLSFARFA